VTMAIQEAAYSAVRLRSYAMCTKQYDWPS